MRKSRTGRSQRRCGKTVIMPMILAAAAFAMAACNLSTPEAPTIQVTEAEQTPDLPATATPTPSVAPPPSVTPDGGQAALLTPPPVPQSPVLEPLDPQADLVIRWIDMIGPQTGWALGGEPEGDDHVLRTADGGLTWVDRSPPQYRSPEAERMAASAFFLDDQQGWAVYFEAARFAPEGGPAQALQVWRTSDGGLNWTAGEPVGVEFIGAEGFVPYLQFLPGEQGWVMARAGGVGMNRYPVYLLHSDDSGATWQALEDPYRGLYLQSCTKTGMVFGSSEIGIVSISACPVDGARIEYTSDGGMTWENVILPAPAGDPNLFEASFCSKVHPADWITSAQVYLAVECNRPEGEQDLELNLLYSSADSGQMWGVQQYPGGELIALDADILLAVSRDIYRSDDGGASWTHIKEVTWDGQFDFVDASRGWAVASGEDELALVRTSDGGETWQLLEVSLSSSQD